MSEWIEVTSLESLQAQRKSIVDLDGDEVVVYSICGEVYAVENRCSHDGGELASGRLADHNIICPRHGARFCLKTGKALSPPAYEDIATFETRVVEGMVQIRDGRWD